MLNLSIKFVDETKNVIKKMQQGTFKCLGHAAATLRMFARSSIQKRKSRRVSSSAGSAPFSHRERGLKSSIFFDVDKTKSQAVIGPSADFVGDSAQAHEFGIVYKGTKFEKRPFMGPAFKKIESRLPKFWEDALR